MPTLKELSVALEKDEEIEYVTESSQTASTKYEVGEKPTSIFTKLYNYPYEFEINGSLQLTSIDGIKVATNLKKDAKLERKVIDEFVYDSRGMQGECGTLEYDISEILPDYYDELTIDNFVVDYEYLIIYGGRI